MSREDLIGNQFWKARTSHGRKRTYENAEALWDDACEYFEWTDANPLIEEKPFAYQGIITMAEVTKMRAMTIEGLCIFLGIAHCTWYTWRDRPDLKDTISQIESIIRTQKFQGAAADLLNSSIIARDLGLAEKTETTHKVIDDGTNEW